MGDFNPECPKDGASGKRYRDLSRKIRCKVEHPFLIVKRQFGYCKTAYRGIAKNMNRFHMLFGCANLLMCIRGGRTAEFRSVCLG